MSTCVTTTLWTYSVSLVRSRSCSSWKLLYNKIRPLDKEFNDARGEKKRPLFWKIYILRQKIFYFHTVSLWGCVQMTQFLSIRCQTVQGSVVWGSGSPLQKSYMPVALLGHQTDWNQCFQVHPEQLQPQVRRYSEIYTVLPVNLLRVEGALSAPHLHCNIVQHAQIETCVGALRILYCVAQG